MDKCGRFPDHRTMNQRYSASVTSLSWIPSEAMTGVMRLPMNLGISHYDDPPPDRIDDLEALRRADRFRFANHLEAWIEVDDDGTIVDAGYAGGGMIGATTLRLGGTSMTIPAVAFSDLQREPGIEGDRAVFVQTAGGRTGAPMPRKVDRPPFVQITAPTAWTTLQLEITTDGSASFEVVGASPFPRHWIYDTDGALAAKSGLTDYGKWSREYFGDHSPWGDVDSPALVTEVETALERQLSLQIMREGEKPEIRSVPVGSSLTRQGEKGEELYLVLDGVLSVDIDGETLAEIGPGAIVGERAALEGGTRTSTLTAITPVKVAVAGHAAIDPAKLEALAAGHRREETSR
jgi:hypothetical protein